MQKEIVYMGIDPGTKGGIYVLNSSNEIIHSCRFSKSTNHDIADFVYLLNKYLCVAVLEKVHAMPNQGVSSTFKFGEAYGTIKGILTAFGIVYHEVTPRLWQKAIGIPAKTKTQSKSQHKQTLKATAQRLFPQEKVLLETADSLLMAYYCKQTY